MRARMETNAKHVNKSWPDHFTPAEWAAVLEHYGKRVFGVRSQVAGSGPNSRSRDTTGARWG